jgi:predicted Rossmann fold flavoprotein
MFDLIVIGGGAAGFFGALQAAEHKRNMSILILEKTTKLLSKVKVSGGGRCNVTHHCFEAKPLAAHYPRGEKPLRELFERYQVKEVVEWFNKKGITLNTEADGRMFPDTDDSQTIIDLFFRESDRHHIEIKTSKAVNGLHRKADGLEIVCEDRSQFSAKNVLIAMGGHTNPQAYAWLKNIGHTIKNPIPSLFTFNDAEKNFKELMGISVPNAFVKIAGTKFSNNGPLLITHWGLSGPAVIRLSAWAAEYLHQQHYTFTALVSWIGEQKEENIREQLLAYKEAHRKQQVMVNPLFQIPQRLWLQLCALAEIEEQKIWNELPLKNLNKLLENLLRCPFNIKGKTTFKEEFVTCGGIPLQEVYKVTMESKKMPNVFFAGEVLDIDGETGGFNFQAAWTTAYLAAKAIAENAET